VVGEVAVAVALLPAVVAASSAEEGRGLGDQGLAVVMLPRSVVADDLLRASIRAGVRWGVCAGGHGRFRTCGLCRVKRQAVVRT
jgi:hypothetical protein